MLKHIATKLLDIAYDETGDTEGNTERFAGRHENRVVPNAGHNLPLEAPEVFADAVLDVDAVAA